MLKKKLVIVLMLVLVLAAIGCGNETEKNNSAVPDNQEPQNQDQSGAVKLEKNNEIGQDVIKDKDLVSVAYVAMTNGSAQVFINEKYNIFAQELDKIGKKVEFIDAHGLQEVYPLMDRKKGAPEFIYIPHTAFTTYNTGKSKYGGSDKYTVIAGSVHFNDVNLVARPEIKSLKDLDGKKVGIANLRYADDFQLNRVLSEVGLGTDTYGGNVEVVWDGIVSELWQNYGEGKYAAIINFDNANNLPKAISMVPGSHVFSLNPDGLFGDKQPRVWLATQKELIKNDPELVKTFLKAHVISTAKALENIDELPAINRELRIKWFADKGALKEDLEKQNTIDKFIKSWQDAEITFDPNMDYASGLHEYMTMEGHFKDISLEEFVRVDLLNEVLEEMGKSPVKVK